MTKRPVQPERILAIDPVPRGFGFVVLEFEPIRLVDWGTSHCRKTDPSLGRSVRRLLARYGPILLVLEEPKTARSVTRRLALSASARVILDAAGADCESRLLRREAVLSALSALGAPTKRKAVRQLAERFPELQAKIPPGRFIWQSEDSRWAIFDALALALTVHGDFLTGLRLSPHSSGRPASI